MNAKWLHEIGPATLYLGDCIEVMRGLPNASIDAVVTDPPYGIGFMGQAWDGADIEKRTAKRRDDVSHAPNAGPNGGHKSAAANAGKYVLTPPAMRAFQEFSEEWALEAFRVLKPGGHLLSFSSPRTYHRMAVGIEDAGFEVRDQAMWLFGSGFPKSRNLEGPWQGWGTALKPAHEPICVARKPLIGTVAANVLAHGVGALNIDACRVGWPDGIVPQIGTPEWGGPAKKLTTAPGQEGATVERTAPSQLGRWPANLIHDGSAEVLSVFPDAPGQLAAASTSDTPRAGQNVYGAMRRGRGTEASANSGNDGVVGFQMKPGARRLDSGSAARFFYCAKASRKDRNEGLTDPGPQFQHGATLRDAENLGAARAGNHHPTVKPTALMAYLVRLVTPPGGLVLDPFMGSGSTGKAAMREGLRFIGIDQSPEYVEIAKVRIAHELVSPKPELDEPAAPTSAVPVAPVESFMASQFDLFARQ